MSDDVAWPCRRRARAEASFSPGESTASLAHAGYSEAQFLISLKQISSTHQRRRCGSPPYRLSDNFVQVFAAHLQGKPTLGMPQIARLKKYRPHEKQILDRLNRA